MNPKFPARQKARQERVEEVRVHGYGVAVEFKTDTGFKISPPERTDKGILDDICETVIDYDAVRKLPYADKELNHYLDMLTNIKVLETEMHMLPESAPPGIRRGISRRMKKHEAQLETQRVIRKATRIRAITSFFTVAKKSGKLRLVVDGRRINDLMKRIPHMDLPAIQEVLMLLMGSRYFCTVDGFSYFYQFGISSEVGELFCANLADTKGEFTTVSLTRMPMGWSWAPAIAQKVSNVLLATADGPLGICWVDNFIFAGGSRGQVQSRFDMFLARADACNVKLDTRTPEIIEVGEVLGMEVDLKNARYRMAQKWVEKVTRLRPARWMTPRQIYTLTGNGIWQASVGGTPLCRWTTTFDLVRRVAVNITAGLDWDVPLRVAAPEIEDMQRWQMVMEDNKWFTLKVEVVPQFRLWSDASDLEWAWVITNIMDDIEVTARQGVFAHPEWHIFVKEAFAANQAAQATRGEPRIMLIDNQPLVFAIKKGLSSNKLVNEWLRSWDWENITVRWVPTTEQKADRYTRGEKVRTASTQGEKV